jgi:hypothetical protein
MRVLFSMRNYWYVRHFESVIRALVARGHQVHLLAERAVNETANDWRDAAVALAADVPGVTFSTAPRAEDDVWYDLRVMLRLGLDYLRFTRPEYETLTLLVERARRRTPGWVRRIADSRLGRTAPARRAVTAALGRAEKVVPPDPAVAAEIASLAADVVAITPLIELGSEQADVVRIAAGLGVPTVLCVGSWDHLSSKGLIRAMPDRVVVWNDTQRREAIEMHGVPAASVVVTGAQVFDGWFERRPTLSREEFCRKVGLNPSHPFVLYVGSSNVEGTPGELLFLDRWRSALRAHPAMREVSVLIRPHPKKAAEFEELELDEDRMVVWPPVATAPTTATSKADYFDSLFYAAAVVGINTSAMIEAAILGRPVLTVLDPDFAGTQEKTVHFRYLLDGGLVRKARSFADHIEQLAAAVAEDGSYHPFVRSFVRPHGLDQPATPLVAAALEQAATLKQPPRANSAGAVLLRQLLWPVARLTFGRFAEQVGRARRRRIEDEERERARIARLPVRAKRRAAAAAERTRIREERDARRAREREQAIARRAAERQARLDAEARARDSERQAREAARAAEATRREAEKHRELAAKNAVVQEKARQKAERLEQHRRQKRAAEGKP